MKRNKGQTIIECLLIGAMIATLTIPFLNKVASQIDQKNGVEVEAKIIKPVKKNYKKEMKYFKG